MESLQSNFAVSGTAFLVFSILYIGVGMWFAKKALSTAEGYFVAGREVGLFVSSGAMAAAYMSGSSMLGYVGLGWLYGFDFAEWATVGCLLTFLLAMALVAPAFRRGNYLSVVDFFGARFGGGARLIIALIIGITYILYLTAQLKGAALLAQSAMGVSYITGLWLFIAIVMIYVILGGMYSVIWTDFIQAVCFVGLMTVLAISALFVFGTPSQMYVQLQQIDAAYIYQKWGKVSASLCMTYLGAFLISTMPHVMIRFFTTKNSDQARKAAGWCVAWLAVFFGIGYFLVIPATKLIAPNINDPDNAVIYAIQFFFKYPWLIGIALSLALAAIFSTASALLFSAATSLSYDMIKYFKPNVDSKTAIRSTQIALIIIAVIATLLAYKPIALIGQIVAMVVYILGATIFIPTLLGVWWKRMNEKALIAGGLTGLITNLVFNFSPTISSAMKATGTIPGFYALLVTVIVIVIVALITQPKDSELKEFYKLNGLSEVTISPSSVGPGLSESN